MARGILSFRGAPVLPRASYCANDQRYRATSLDVAVFAPHSRVVPCYPTQPSSRWEGPRGSSSPRLADVPVPLEGCCQVRAMYVRVFSFAMETQSLSIPVLNCRWGKSHVCSTALTIWAPLRAEDYVCCLDSLGNANLRPEEAYNRSIS
ncbi:hypothetical protein ERJ75_000990600 [Trypanosoma vivax]|nr:hypothetical protein ERJ75_000990600 [Trypanosoma vivax]